VKSISEHSISVDCRTFTCWEIQEFAGSIQDFLSISNAHLSDKQPIRWRHLLEGKSGHVGSKPSWSEIFSMAFRFFTAEKLYHANPQWPKQMGYSWPILRRTKGSPGSAAAKTQRGSWSPCVAINVVWDLAEKICHGDHQFNFQPYPSDLLTPFDPLWLLWLLLTPRLRLWWASTNRSGSMMRHGPVEDWQTWAATTAQIPAFFIPKTPEEAMLGWFGWGFALTWQWGHVAGQGSDWRWSSRNRVVGYGSWPQTMDCHCNSAKLDEWRLATSCYIFLEGWILVNLSIEEYRENLRQLKIWRWPATLFGPWPGQLRAEVPKVSSGRPSRQEKHIGFPNQSRISW